MKIHLMLVLILWIILDCSTIAVEEKRVTPKELPFIIIEPLSSQAYGSLVVKRVQDTLNLTCTVFDNLTDSEPRYNIMWTTPSSLTNSKNHIVIHSLSANSVNLLIPNLETRDEGEYSCLAEPLSNEQEALNATVRVNIKNKKCGNTMFTCNLSKIQNCIHKRFVCDGHPDCKMGEDEDQEVCGVSVCSNKVQCKDVGLSIVRCIPKSWCCNAREDPSCPIKEPLSCCPPTFRKSYMDGRNYYANHQPHVTDMTLLQTTIYTVIGSAMVLMIIVTVLVIFICRIHMKRSMMSQSPANLSQPFQLLQNTPLYDLNMYLNRGCGLDNLPPTPPGFLVTYNINNGVQIMGHAIDPPPYCEVITAPPKKGPPPPYTSCGAHDISESETLLQQPSVISHNGSGMLSQPLRIVSNEELQSTSSEYETAHLYTVPNSVSTNVT